MEINYLEQYELLPENVYRIVEELGEGPDFPELREAESKLEKLGYKLHWSLGGIYALTKTID